MVKLAAPSIIIRRPDLDIKFRRILLRTGNNDTGYNDPETTIPDTTATDEVKAPDELEAKQK